jgi:NAD(P)-dependent dehydrogenase (short-subunit alcohol dehydrogenase family)
MSLAGQVILITGASRGIGRAVALRLAREQPEHILIGYCLNHGAALQTVADINSLGVSASPIGVDVGRNDLLSEMFDDLYKRFGRLDVFVSNAARSVFGPAIELSMRDWQRVMDMNARAFLLGSQMAARIMRENGSGRIIGISSLGSQYYVPNYAALGVAKAAMEALARYLAVEFAPWGINVNVVSGGFVDTPSMHLVPSHKEMIEYILAHTPEKRLGRPEDLAGVVSFLCTPDSDWIRGQTLIVDGGFSLGMPG